MPPRRTRRALRRALIALIVLGLTCAGAYVARRPLLTAAAEFLIIRDEIQPSRFAVLLGGDFEILPRTVAGLLNQGLAQQVLLVQVRRGGAAAIGLTSGYTSLQVQMLRHYGVPEDAIVVFSEGDGVTSTYEEAVAVRRFVGARQDEGFLTVVTHAVHTRRTRWIFSRLFDDLAVTVQMVPIPYATFGPGDWWTKEDGLIYVTNEYLKFGLYRVKYRRASGLDRTGM